MNAPEIKYPELYQYFCSLQPIPLSEWNKAVKFSRLTKLKKKEIFIRPGDKIESYIVTLSGLLRMYYTDANGNEYIKAFRDKNEMAAAYGELVQKIPSKLSIAAIEASEILEIPYSLILELSEEHTCWEKLMLKLLVMQFLYKEQREYELLIMDAAERYESFRKEHPELLNRVPQYQIASYLGVTPVTLSRLQSQR